MQISWARVIRDRCCSWALSFAPLLLACAVLDAQSLAGLTRAYRASPTPAGRSALLRYAAAHKDATGALAQLALATKQIEQKQFPEALENVTAAAHHLPLLADYTAYLSAVTQFELARYSGIHNTLAPVWNRNPGSPLVDKALVLESNAYLKNNEPKKVIALLESHSAGLTAPEAQILLGHAYEQAGNPSQAAAHFETVLSNFPLSSEAAELESDPAQLARLTPTARLTRCRKLIEGGDSVRSRRELEALIPQLSGADRDLAAVKLGLARLLGRDNQGACDGLTQLHITAPELEAERLFYLVRCARRLDRPDDFKPPLDRLAALGPQSSWRLQAFRAAGDYLWQHNDTPSYQPLYRACAEAFQAEPSADECQWRLAFSEYRQRAPAPNAGFELLLKRYPDSLHVPAAIYFLGRISEARSDPASARAWYEALAHNYPNYFYATLAREKLQSPALLHAAPSPAALSRIQASLPAPHRRTENFAPTSLTKARNQRAQMLASAGLDDLAESELRFGAKTDGEPQVAALELAELAALRGAPDQGIRVIKQLAPHYLMLPFDAAPQRFWRLAFPLPFRDSLEQYSKQQGLDPFLVAALIRQESEFNPRIVSHANAFGLTQVLPSTGRDVSRKLSLGRFRSEMLFQPDTNLKIGTYFLRSLLDRLEGNWAATLASYNAGAARVAKWLTWGQFAEPAEFIETIPFEETRNYVTSVFRNADIYRRLYGPKSTMH